MEPSKTDCGDKGTVISFNGVEYWNPYYRYYSYTSKYGVKEIDLGNRCYSDEVWKMANGEPVDIYDKRTGEYAFKQVSFYNIYDYSEDKWRLKLTTGKSNLDRTNQEETSYARVNTSVKTTVAQPVISKSINEVSKADIDATKRIQEEQRRKEEQEQEEKKINEAWAKASEEQKREYVKRAYSDYSEYAKPKYPTLIGKPVKSKEEVIIVDRVVHWLKGFIEYEHDYLVGHKPDFYVRADEKESQWVWWEHLGGWNTPEELYNYKQKNLNKLCDYLNHFSENPKDLPRISFPLSDDTDWAELGKQVPNFLDVTSSEEKLKEFLNKEPLEYYRNVLEFYKNDLKKYGIDVPAKYKKDWQL